MRLSLFSTFFLVWGSLSAQERQPVVKLSNVVPNHYALSHASIFVSPENKLSDATIIVKDGMIEAVGVGIDIPKDAVERNMNGAWIYAAWIDAFVSQKSVNQKSNDSEASNQPQYKSNTPQTTYWNDAIKSQINLSELGANPPENAKDLRSLGFGLWNILPSDGIFRGTGALMLAGEGNPKQDIISLQSAAAFSFMKGSSTQSYPNSLMGAIALIRQTLWDAESYEKGQQAFKKNPHQSPLDPNISLAAFIQQKENKLPMIFETNSWQHTLAAQNIAKEFDIQWIYKTTGDEYKYLSEFQKMKTAFIVPLNFPKPYNIKNVVDGREIALQKLKEWEQSPLNPSLLAKNNILFSFTATGTSPDDFMANLRKSIDYGLSETDALKALTTHPAKILAIEKQVGTLEKGKIANLIISSGNIFQKENKIYEVHIAGQKYEVNKAIDIDFRGNYAFQVLGRNYNLKIKGDSLKQNADVFFENDTVALKMTDFSLEKNQLSFTFKTKEKQTWVYNGIHQKNETYLNTTFYGTLTDSNAINYPLTIERNAPFKRENKKNDKKGGDKKVDIAHISPITYPNKVYGWKEIPKIETIIIQGVKVWTNTEKGILENTDVLLENGKIAAVGQGLKVPDGAKVIDGKGKHLSAGIIDEHSHIAILDGVNEASHAVTAEVRIGDVIDCEDINIYRQLAGGVTSAQLLHGSANPIGGQSQIIKLRWGASPEEMKFAEAPGFIKFALGENVKQSNAGDNMRSRYPQTRMGVEQMMEDVFLEAKDYRKTWEEWEKNGKSKHLIPPKKDLQLETLLEILDGKRYITCHSYVQSEITMLMRLAERTGFKINTFTHILEGYKIADKMLLHGANASTFADWWAYKMEVMEAIPYNSALMTQQGLNVCVNSDDAEMGRRLNQEAAKGVKYGGMKEEDALKMVTLNPAKALHIDKYVGSIEKGKQADVVLWSDNPLSIYAKALYTFIDGKCYFDAQKEEEMRKEIVQERSRLLLKMLENEGDKQDASKGKKEQKLYHCNTVE